MKNKKNLLIAGILILLVAAMLTVYFVTRPETQQGAKAYTVVVIHADGGEKTFNLRTDEEYLGAVLMAEGLVEGEMGPYGLMISAVDGEEAVWEVNSAYWALFVGDEYATSGADSTPIYDGSTFKLEYTIG